MGFDDFPDDLDDKKEKSLLAEDEAAEETDHDANDELDLSSLEVTEQQIDAEELQEDAPSENSELDFQSLEETQDVKRERTRTRTTSTKARGKKNTTLVLKEKTTANNDTGFVYKNNEWVYKNTRTGQKNKTRNLTKAHQTAKTKTKIKDKTQTRTTTRKLKEDDSFIEANDPSLDELTKNTRTSFGTKANTKIKEEGFTEDSFRTISEKSKTIKVTDKLTGTMTTAEETFLETPVIQARLLVRAGRLKKKFFPLSGDTLILGRSIDADITVPDKRASRSHAKIYYSEGHYLLEDLNSANGIKVNGERVERQLLQSRDRISIGNTVLEFVVIDEEQYLDPTDETIELDYDTSSPTELATSLTSKTKTGATIRSAKTEVYEDGTDLLPDTAFKPAAVSTQVKTRLDDSLLAENVTGTEMPLGMQTLQTDMVDKPFAVKKLRPLFAIVLFIMLLGLISMLLLPGKKEELAQDKQKTDKAIVPNNNLNSENESLAIQYYNKAKKYYEQGEYKNAITEARRALGVYSDFTQAQELIEYSVNALEEAELKTKQAKQRAKQEALFEKKENLLNEADRLLVAKKYSEALKPINAVLKLDPGNEEAKGMLREARAGISSQQRTVAIMRNRRRIMLQRLNEADKFFNTGQYPAALKSYNRVLAMGRRTSPGTYDKASAQHRIAQQKIMEMFQPKLEEAKGMMATQNYSGAYKILNNILLAYSGHREALMLRKKAMEELTLQVRKIYQNALVMESINDLEEAVKGYQEILKLVPKDHEYYKKSLEKIKKYN